jgi:hypothetical protein
LTLSPGPDRTAPPALSIVIAAATGPAALRTCLGSIAACAMADDVEVLVARNFDGEAAAMLGRDFPFVHDVPCPAGTTVPHLRGAGIAASRGGIVALLEDHCTVTPGWAAALRAAHAAGHEVVGGPVDQAPGLGPLDWAVYLYDYGRYMPPCAEGPAPLLSGINVSYARGLLEPARRWREEGLFEARFHPALAAGGLDLWLAADAVVLHQKRYRLGPAIESAFHLARGYAAQRVDGRGAAARAAFGAGALALPVLLPARTLATVVPKGRHLGAVARAVPLLVVLQLAWSAGECAGYLAGAGSSLERWH